MEIIYFLVPIGIVMLGVAIGLFSWAVKSDQFDDLDREGRRILFDEDMVAPQGKSTTNSPASATAAEKVTPPDNGATAGTDNRGPEGIPP